MPNKHVVCVSSSDEQQVNLSWPAMCRIPSYDAKRKSNTSNLLGSMPCKLVTVLRWTTSETAKQSQFVWFCVNVRLTRKCWHMMTSSNGNILRVTGPLCGEFITHRWIPLTKARDAELWCLLWSGPDKQFRDAGDLRRLHAYYDASVMNISHLIHRSYSYSYDEQIIDGDITHW